MNLHEYQSKQLFAHYGMPVPRGKVADSAASAVAAAEDLGGKLWVVKAQVHAGGRGKAGGVALCRTLDEVREAAGKMIGMTLVTHQTGPEGLPVKQLLVEAGSDISRELYLSVVVDRASERVTFMASTEGGMDIEEVAEKTPEKIFRVAINPAAGLQAYQVRELAFGLGITKEQFKDFSKVVNGLYDMFVEKDASLVEINPLIITTDHRVVVLDAKVNLDDSAMFRHPDLAEMRDPSQEDEKENIAHEHGFNYVSLDGDIACMVNGAGLAMATMDLIKLHGGEPANFLDVGGGATKERVTEAFKLILSNRNVKAILVNIFGGIVRCDLIAEGIIAAVKDVGVNVPVVARLEGTNVEKGREMLANSGLAIQPANDLTDAATKVVAAVER
ncbi:MAG TPA: ADP-forming succinate--CoA ligase subunit beta [Gammaproteobacteria bacterium]